jgi:hypothetical protein
MAASQLTLRLLPLLGLPRKPVRGQADLLPANRRQQHDMSMMTAAHQMDVNTPQNSEMITASNITLNTGTDLA